VVTVDERLPLHGNYFTVSLLLSYPTSSFTPLLLCIIPSSPTCNYHALYSTVYTPLCGLFSNVLLLSCFICFCCVCTWVCACIISSSQRGPQGEQSSIFHHPPDTAQESPKSPSYSCASSSICCVSVFPPISSFFLFRVLLVLWVEVCNLL